MSRSWLALLVALAPLVGCSADKEKGADWKLSRVSRDGLTLPIAYEIGDPWCERLARVEKEERPATVVLRVIVRYWPDAGPCGDVLRVRATSVRLGKPLGRRTLIDAGTGRICRD